MGARSTARDSAASSNPTRIDSHPDMSTSPPGTIRTTFAFTNSSARRTTNCKYNTHQCRLSTAVPTIQCNLRCLPLLSAGTKPASFLAPVEALSTYGMSLKAKVSLALSIDSPICTLRGHATEVKCFGLFPG